MSRKRPLAALVLTGMLAAAGQAQELTVLDPGHTRLIAAEVSGDAAYEHVRFMTQFHRPRGGSDGLWAVAEYVARVAEAYGLTDVRVIKQASTTPPWNARFADLQIVAPEPQRLASTLQTPLHLADYSRSADVTGELVDVGAGEAGDLEGRDLEGKILLTYGSIGDVMQRGVCQGGAAGIVWYPDPFTPDQGTSGAGVSRPDQLRWLSVPSERIGACEPTFAFNLSTRQGIALHNRLAAADAPVVAHAVVESAFDSEQGAEPWQVMVEAFLPGTEPDLGQDIVLTGHLQEEGFSANDDASGSASTLEVARALHRLVEAGRLPRPRRTIRFWWVTEISSQRQYFADHPDAHHAMWVNVNQDMVGADQSQDVMRKQNVTRVPATRFHFFNDVVEAVVEYMVRTNTYELAQAQAGGGLYPRPHVASLGTLHRYNAEMIFFHSNSDHMPFFEAPIGMPAVSFTNMPDRFIHSSDDDLWNIDRTQLGRNAAAVALIAYAMASADAADVPRLAALTAGMGSARMGRNLGLGLAWIAGDDDKATAYFHAVDQVRYAAARERLAVGSLREIHADAARLAEQLSAEVGRREEQALRELDVVYRAVTAAAPPRRRPGETEQALQEMRPALVADAAGFAANRNRAGGGQGMHGLMRMEVVNAVDGSRTGLDIFRYVAAEAREAGAHYYGTVTAEAVREVLEEAAAAGLLRLR